MYMALTENFVLQSLMGQFETMPRYWSRLNPSYTVELIVQYENMILPVQIDPYGRDKGRGLKKYARTYPKETPLRIRFSPGDLSWDGDTLNIPLFMADHTVRLIEMALAEK